MQVALHQLDLLLLFDDDALSKTSQNWIAAVDQFKLGHVDRALVMRNHHRGEIAIGIARRLCAIMPASMRCMACIICAANPDSGGSELVSL